MSSYPRSFLLLTLLAAAPSAPAGDLGRLFYTPQQRQQLEYQEASSGVAGSEGRGYVVVNGVVQKQGGKRTVWINGVPQTEGRGNDQVPASVSISVPGKKQPVQTKVGQKIPLDQPAAENAK